MQANIPNMGQFYSVGNPYDGSSVTLYVFPPKHHSNQVRRPHSYNFSPQFIDNVQETVANAVMRDANVIQASRMYDSTAAAMAVMPNSVGATINLSTFSALWSFFLVIDLKSGANVNYYDTTMFGSNSPNAFDSRYVYSGYFSDEPFAMGISNIGGRASTPAPNTSATLIITHHSSINKASTINVQGCTDRWVPSSDLNIIPSHAALQLNDTNSALHLMTPSKLSTNVGVPGDDEILIFAGRNTQLTPAQNEVTVGTINSARTTGADIVATLIDATANVTSANVAGPVNDGFTMHTDIFSPIGPHENAFTDAARAMFATSDVSATRCRAPLNPASPVSLGEILRLYPNTHVVNCTIPFESQWDAFGQEAPNMLNVLSSLISSTMPVVLANHGLSDITFRYRTRPIDAAAFVLNFQPIYEIYNVAGLVMSSDDQLTAKCKILMDHLRHNLFPTITAAAGEFDLMLSCSVAGTSLVDLKLLDYPTLIQNGAYFETNNALGGLMSPAIGSTTDFKANAESLYGLMSAISVAPISNQSVRDNLLAPMLQGQTIPGLISPYGMSMPSIPDPTVPMDNTHRRPEQRRPSDVIKSKNIF